MNKKNAVQKSSWASSRASFHHGDLKAELVAAAKKMVQKDGAENLSLRGVARAAGVSEAAPYNHFSDKNALLAEVAASGFRDLQAKIAKEDSSKKSKLNAIDNSGVAYVEFAVENPALFRLMFGKLRGGMDAQSSNLKTQSKAIYNDLEMRSQDHNNVKGKDTSPNRKKDIGALRDWVQAHGLALLLIDRGIKPTDYGLKDVRKLVEAVFNDSG